ncbi:MAG TPA: hypothetical protein VE619_07570 [Nitrososphaeraceae archaeon]|nr:hypothetical protein [Nitrososphaeraceae archaeon]
MTIAIVATFNPCIQAKAQTNNNSNSNNNSTPDNDGKVIMVVIAPIQIADWVIQ